MDSLNIVEVLKAIVMRFLSKLMVNGANKLYVKHAQIQYYRLLSVFSSTNNHYFPWVCVQRCY